MNLNTILKNLSDGNLPANQEKWAKLKENEIDEAIQNLSFLILKAVELPCKHQKDWIQRLHEIDDINNFLSKTYGSNRKIDLNALKLNILNEVANNALAKLVNPKPDSSAMKAVLGGLEEIWHQQQDFELFSTDSEKEKLKEIETRVNDLIQTKDMQSRLKSIAKEIKTDHILDYLNHIEGLNKAIATKDLTALENLTNTEKFPLNIRMDSEGNTLLHLVANWPEAVDMLLRKSPLLADEPNDLYKLPLKEVHFNEDISEKSMIRSPPSSRGTGKDPNLRMLAIKNLISSNKPDAEVIHSLNKYSNVINGQRGRNLLHAAIESGSLVTVKKLLDLGVSPKGIYGLPLSKKVDSTTTPLHQAIMAGHLDIASLLIEKGAEIDALDKKGDSIIDLIKRHRELSNNFKLRNWMEGKIGDLAVSRQQRFDKAIELKNWPEITNLIQNGFNPKSKLDPHISEILVNKQFHLFKLLVEDGYVKNAIPGAVEVIVNPQNQSPGIYFWFLAKLVESNTFSAVLGVTPQQFLKLALERSNFNLAAFLVTLGAKPEGPNAAAITHYANALAQGTPAENKLRVLLDAKNIGHLVGDTIIKDMKDDYGNKIEGNKSSESIAFFNAALKYAAEEHPEISTGEFQHFMENMDRAADLALQCESIRHLKDDQLISQAIQLLEKDMLEQIDKLTIGEAVIIPAGWYSGDSGHAILVECKNIGQNKIEINVINTGEGAEYHDGFHDSARLHLNTVRRYVATREQLDEHSIISRILEPQVASSSNRGYYAEEFYSFLDLFYDREMSTPTDVVDPSKKTRKAQLSGTCSLRCWLAYAKQKLNPVQYKTVKRILSESVVKFAVEQNEKLLDKQPALTKLLSLAMPTLFNTAGKFLAEPTADLKREEELLEKLKKTSSILQKSTPPTVSAHETVSLSPFFPTKTKEITNAIQELLGTDPFYYFKEAYKLIKAKILTKEISPLSAPLAITDMDAIDSIKGLENYLESLSQYVKIPDDAQEGDYRLQVIMHCLTSAIIPLGRASLPNAPESPLKDVFTKLKDDPDACLRIIEKIDFLTNQLSKASIKCKMDNVAFTMAIHYALISSWELSLLIESHKDLNPNESLSNYKLDLSSILDGEWKQGLQPSPIFNAELENDLKLLRDYAQVEGAKRAPKLMSWIRLRMDNTATLVSMQHFHSKNSYCGDYEYAKALAKNHTNWDAADLDYAQNGRSSKGHVDKEVWRLHWYYLNCLPPHLKHLQRLGFLKLFNKRLPDSLCEIGANVPLSPQKRTDSDIVSPSFTLLNKSYHFDEIPGFIPTPQKKGELAVDSSDSNYLNLIGSSSFQNKLAWNKSSTTIRELMSIRIATIKSGNMASPLAVPLLLDFFSSEHKDLFSKVEYRIFFEMTLLSGLCFPAAIKQIPNLEKELKEFFESTIAFFEDRVLLSIEKTSSTEALTFLYTTWQRILVYLQHEEVLDVNGELISGILNDTRNKIQTLIDDPDFQSFDIQQQLHLALLDSYHGEAENQQKLVEDVVTCLASYYKSLQENKQSECLTPAFINSALTVPIKQGSLIQNVLKNEQELSNSIFSKIAKQYNQEVPKNAVWKEQTFPCYECRAGNQLFEFDMLTGVFRVNGKEPFTLSLNIRNASKSYQELFGEKIFSFIDNGSYLETTDEFGKIQIYTTEEGNISDIRREIQGQWYSHIPADDTKSHPPLPPLANKDTLGIWISHDDKKHYLLADQSSLTPVIRLDVDGRLTLLKENPNIRWEWVDQQALSGKSQILNIDPSAFILQEDTSGKQRAMLLQFPHIVDPSGEILEFERRELKGINGPRWAMKHQPHLFISLDQTLPGIRNVKQFIITENLSGSREAIIPIKTKEQLDSKEAVNASCISVNIKQNTLSSQDPKANIYLAYLALIHAVTPEDYQQAMKFLQQARKFEAYTPEELRLLGWIFQSPQMTSDATGPANAIRLFTAWLVNENFKRNPQSRKAQDQLSNEIKEDDLSAMSPPEHWERFWSKKYPTGMEDLISSYFSTQQHLPLGMRMQEIMTPQELMDWNIGLFATSGPISHAPQKNADKIEVKVSDIELLIRMKPSRHTPQVLLPGRPLSSLQNEFPALLDAAVSNNPERRAIAEKQYRAMQYDPETKVFAAILFAALNSGEKHASEILDFAHKIMKNNLGGDVLYKDREPDQRKSAIAHDLEVLINKYLPQYPVIQTPPNNITEIKPVTVLPPKQQIVLPSDIPVGNQLLFAPATEVNIPLFENLFNRAFEVSQDESEIEITPFKFETDDPWLQQGIDELNNDYAIGIKKNQQVPHYQLKEGLMEQLFGKERDAIANEADAYSDKTISKKESAILQLANQLPSDTKASLTLQVEIASGRKKSLEIKDCIGLFLQGSPDAYRSATNLENKDEILKLHNMIGDYILTHNKANRYKETLKSIDRLKNVYQDKNHTKTQLAAAMQRVAENLSLNKAIDPAVDPRAFMVFEYGLNLTLKPHQVEGLRDMLEMEKDDPTRFRSVLLQRIQGGGKSLVFGHIMALLKADGYHLSVHVPVTAQYQTSLYDMSARSEELFGQRERTLVFDDDPLKFTPEYLTWMNNMLKEAVVNREYVTVTNETLRALRCKYIKTRFEIRNGREDLEPSNQILKEILFLLRTRGIFTFDEMHKAFDPLKELNMPYGEPERPNTDESRLISKIIKLGCLPLENGKVLIDLEHSAQQTEEQFSAMKEHIIDGLMKEPGWNDPEIKAYLQGVTEDIPSFLESEENSSHAKLVILARQMLAGNWLKERLNTNVNEHHGIPDEGFPRVSIPFLANMKAAIGSEFSDRYVMTTNTLIAYLVSGLNELQTKDLIEISRQKADAEKRKMAENNPSASIQDTPSSQAFKAATEFELFRIDLDKQEDILSVQQALKKMVPETVDLLLEYIIEREIGSVELFENQVCSNGQNVASMCQSFVAYSASMENSNMAPVGSIPKPEKGTNGQTIDLLISQKTEVHLVEDNNIQSLFDMMKNHPRKKNIHAIIDVGAYFRGMRNEAAAKMICDYLKDTQSDIQGVLFFDTAKGNLCFMQRDPPNSIKTLSMTTPEAIEAETGFKTSQLFTYYDQEHMTGVDIEQDEECIAITTMSEHTMIHEYLQGVRRLRQLDKLQRIITAIPKGAVESIQETLGKTYKSGIAPNIKDLFLYSHIKEAQNQKTENMPYCLQKMENLVQQLILDKLFPMDISDERALFKDCAYLFEKNVAIDLYKQFAHKQEAISSVDYLNKVKISLTEPLIAILPQKEVDDLRHAIDNQVLKSDVFKGIEPTVNIPSSSVKNNDLTIPTTGHNRETSRLQTKQQVRSGITQQTADMSHESLSEYLNQAEGRWKRPVMGASDDFVIRESDFYSGSILNAQNNINPNYRNICSWEINGALTEARTPLPSGISFEKEFLTTNNAAQYQSVTINLTGPQRKKPWPLLVSCVENPDGTKSWKVMLCSIKDGFKIQQYFDNSGKSAEKSFPQNMEMWLMRSNGKPIAGDSPLDIDSDPKLSLLMTQALFFAGDFNTLSFAPWKARMDAWFNGISQDEREKWTKYFEETILMGFPPGYKSSHLYDYLHPKD